MTGTAVAALAVTALSGLYVFHTLTHISAELAPTEQVAAQIRDERAASGDHQPCLVITELHVYAAWVSRCDARQPGAVHAVPATSAVYVIEFSGSRPGPVLRHVQSLAPQRLWNIQPVSTTRHRARGVPRTGFLAVSPAA